jgi:hypothetical protein
MTSLELATPHCASSWHPKLPGLAIHIGYTSEGPERSPGARERETEGPLPPRSGDSPYVESGVRLHRSPPLFDLT